MKSFDRNFWANGSSVAEVNGVQPESRTFKLSNGGSLGPYYSEKLASKNEHFSKRKIAIDGQPLGIFQRKFTIYHSFEGPQKGAFGFLQKSFFGGFLEKLKFSTGCRHGLTSTAVADTQLKIPTPQIFSTQGWTFKLG